MADLVIMWTSRFFLEPRVGEVDLWGRRQGPSSPSCHDPTPAEVPGSAAEPPVALMVTHSQGCVKGVGSLSLDWDRVEDTHTPLWVECEIRPQVELGTSRKHWGRGPPHHGSRFLSSSHAGGWLPSPYLEPSASVLSSRVWLGGDWDGLSTPFCMAPPGMGWSPQPAELPVRSQEPH